MLASRLDVSLPCWLVGLLGTCMVAWDVELLIRIRRRCSWSLRKCLGVQAMLGGYPGAIFS